MSDNPSLNTFGFCSKCGYHLNVCHGEHAPQPPALRISEEEIQLLTGKLYIGLVNEPIYTWHEKCAAILRSLNESK